MNKHFKVIGGIVTLISAMLLAWYRLSKPSAIEEFHSVLAGPQSGRIKTISINGQQTHITIVDPAILSEMESAMSARSTNLPESGISYEVCLTFKSGREFKTFLYLYDRNKGFAIADEPKTLLADPLMIDVRFPKSIDIELQKVLARLSEERK